MDKKLPINLAESAVRLAEPYRLLAAIAVTVPRERSDVTSKISDEIAMRAGWVGWPYRWGIQEPAEVVTLKVDLGSGPDWTDAR